MNSISAVLFVAAAFVAGSAHGLECEVFQESEFYVQVLEAKMACQRSPFLILSPSFDAYENLCVLEKLGALIAHPAVSKIVLNWDVLDALFADSDLGEMSETCAYVLPAALAFMEDGETKRFSFDSCDYHQLDSAIGDLFMCTLDQVKVECSEEIIIELIPAINPDGICYTPVDAYTFSLHADFEVSAEFELFIEGDIAGESLDIVAGMSAEYVAAFEAVGIVKPSQLLIELHSMCSRAAFIEWLKEYIIINEIDANEIFFALIGWCARHEYECFDIIIEGGSSESSSGSKSKSSSSSSSEEIACATYASFEATLTAELEACTPAGNPKIKPFNSILKKKPRFYENPYLCALNRMNLIQVGTYHHVSVMYSSLMVSLGCSATVLAEAAVVGLTSVTVFTPIQYVTMETLLVEFVANIETVCMAV